MTPAQATPQDRARLEEVIADLIGEADGATDTITRVECLREVASIYESQLGDLPRALVAWQAAFSEDPRDDQSALGIERVTQALGQWSLVLIDGEELLAQVIAPGPRAALLVWLARWQERFAHDDDGAEQKLEEALALDPMSLAVAEALSALHRKQGDWARAADVCRQVGLATDDVEAAVGLLLEAARLIHTRVGDADGAMQLYRRVLELDPRNGAAAEALAEAAGAALEPAVICARYRQALEVDPDNVQVMRQWADVAVEHARWTDVRFLLDTLLARVGVGPGKQDTRARLNEALDRFVAVQKWPEAIDVLRTLARESTGALAAKYFATAGKIAQHELRDEETALALYERALEVQPEDTRTFDRVFAMLSARRSWPQAEKALRRMIDRLREAGESDNPDLMLPLWRRLGDVYRSGLRNMAAAAEAYSECARLAPQDRYARMVAELTARSPVLAALSAR
jgi:tetratricopeptide (TPR) repeat protein